MSTAFNVGNRRIGGTAPCFVIAEGGINHNGSPDLAHKLVDLAADLGADAIKFQTFDPPAVVAPAADVAPYQSRYAEGGQLEMLTRLALPVGIWCELSQHAFERGIIFLSTPFDEESLELLLDAGVAALKIPSGEVDNLKFIDRVSACGRPVIISTGMSTLEEVRVALNAARRAPAIALMHCVTAYPATDAGSNLRAMVTMTQAFGVPVGWSDHTVGVVSAVAAVALGASLLEKHLTVDRDLDGPDHRASADPRAFSDYVAAVRAAEMTLGDGTKVPTNEELENRRFVRRSYHATRDLDAGDRIEAKDIALLRPADGLPPTSNIIGRELGRPVTAGRPITDSDLR